MDDYFLTPSMFKPLGDLINTVLTVPINDDFSLFAILAPIFFSFVLIKIVSLMGDK